MGCTPSKTAVTPSEEQKRPKDPPLNESSTDGSGWRSKASQKSDGGPAHVSTQHVAATDAELARGHSPASQVRTATHESGQDEKHTYSASVNRKGAPHKDGHSLGSAVTAGSSTVFPAGSNSDGGTSRSQDQKHVSTDQQTQKAGSSAHHAADTGGDASAETESRHASDLGATSDSESVHEFDEELDANHKVEVIRNQPTVRVNGAPAGFMHDDARSTTTAEYGVASEEDGSGGSHSRQHSDGGREASAARSAQHSSLSTHSVAVDGPGSLHVERHLEVPGGAPQPSPYKQQHKAFGKLTDESTEMHSIQEGSSLGSVASGAPLPPPRAPTESRVLRNVQSFRAVTGKAIPRARRDGVMYVQARTARSMPSHCNHFLFSCAAPLNHLSCMHTTQHRRELVGPPALPNFAPKWALSNLKKKCKRHRLWAV